jgi:hypothetical protein
MEMMRFLGACLLVFQAAAVLADDGDKQGAGLLDAGRLEKFVDELPDMPALRGYGVGEGGMLVAGELTVGMYDTTWVRSSTRALFYFPLPLRLLRQRRDLDSTVVHVSVQRP